MKRKIKRLMSLVFAVFIISSNCFYSYSRASAIAPALEYTASELLPWLFTAIAGSAGAYALSDEAIQELTAEYISYAVASAPDLSVELGDVDFTKLSAVEKEDVAKKVLTHAKVIQPDWGGNNHNRKIKITEGLVAAVGAFLATKLIGSTDKEALKSVKSTSYSFNGSIGDVNCKFNFDVVSVPDIYMIFESYRSSLKFFYSQSYMELAGITPAKLRESLTDSEFAILNFRKRTDKYGLSVPFDEFRVFNLPDNYRTINALYNYDSYVRFDFLDKSVVGGVSVLPYPKVNNRNIVYNPFHENRAYFEPFSITGSDNASYNFDRVPFAYAAQSEKHYPEGGNYLKVFIDNEVVFTFNAPYNYIFDGAAPLEIPLQDGELEVTLPKVEEMPDLYKHASKDVQDEFKKYIGDLLSGNAQPGTQPGTQPGLQPGTQPGTQPGLQPGTQPGLQPGTQPGTQPGLQPGTQPGSNFNIDFKGQDDGNYSIAGVFKTKFPFCIPFDLINSFKLLRASPTPPKWIIPIKFGAVSYTYDFVIDLSVEPWYKLTLIIRYFTLLSYIVSLVVLTRNLIRG